ncbi:MAG: peptidyl-prolyl cis-trans isomerase [Novosphingobium sp.]|nr:peptidyl-prolyl cis-trans isomerase [Novosphingobium sp.]
MARIGAGAVLRRVVREPLVHFLAIGLMLFAAAQHWRRAHELDRIEVTPARVAQIAGAYRAEYGHDPDAKALEHEIGGWVDDEMLFREGLARGLDKDDEIVRRRVIQKVAFLERDLAAPTADDAALRAWYAGHTADYTRPGAVDFTQVFFADGTGGPAAARARAARVLAGLPDGQPEAAERGDPFPDASRFAAFTPDEARRVFGEGELAQRLFALPTGHWAGPFRSAYGWHLVRVSAASAPQRLPFDEVRERVANDVAGANAETAQRRIRDALARRYTVVREDRG